MVVLPPGTILQRLYLKERLKRLKAGSFIEVGPGRGDLSAMLLGLGWRGHLFELDETNAAYLRSRFSTDVDGGRLMVTAADFLEVKPDCKADLVISCMVMEHFDDQGQMKFLRQAAACLRPGGRLIGIVPGSPEHWGVEDEIAGHFRRYSRDAISKLAKESHWRLTHLVGLTYPLSNMLLPVSDFLVRRAERKKLSLSLVDRTKASGRRSVPFKTSFPAVLGLLLNEFTLVPWHWAQKIFSGARRCMVLYFEAEPDGAR